MRHIYGGDGNMIADGLTSVGFLLDIDLETVVWRGKTRSRRR